MSGLDLPVAGLPFVTSASHEGVWTVADDGAVHAKAMPHSDFYVNPGGAESGDAASLLNAATLLGTPPAGDFRLSARVAVDFAAQFDAGVLMVWQGERSWAKFCFELSPASEPMVVSVVTRGTSDDANAFVVDGRSVHLRLSRTACVYAMHASTQAGAAGTWRLVRVFTLGDDVTSHRVGFEVQSPTGDGVDVAFDDVAFSTAPLTELRDGS